MGFRNFSPQGLAWTVGRYGLHLGTMPPSRAPIRLKLKWLETGIHVIGPTASGKTRLLLHLFAQLVVLPRATVILLNPKGALGRMARDLCVQLGLTPRLLLFDPSDPELLPGFNPLRPNALPIATQAKAVRDALLAGHGQTEIDKTRQLARHMLLSLYAARERGLTLVDAARLLRAGSSLRPRIIAALVDTEIRDALEHFHRQPPQRQDQLAASTLACLETATMDPLLRHILTHPHGLDVGELIANHGILIADIRQGQPLRPNDVKFLGRLLLNDILAHVFERGMDQPDPVYLLIDEVEMFATEDLCRAFDLAREPGLRTVIAHQHLEQLQLEGGDRRLRISVDTDLRTKIVFGGLPTAQLQEIVPDLFLDRWDPRIVKDEITSLEVEPVEATRTSHTFSTGQSHGRTKTDSEAAMVNAGRSIAHTLAAARGRQYAHTRSRAFGTSEGEFTSRGTGAGVSCGMAMLPDGQVVSTDATSYLDQAGSGESFVSTTIEGNAITEGVVEQQSEGETWSQNVGEARTTAQSTAVSGVSNVSVSVTTLPFHELRKRRVTTSRAFLTYEEFILECIKVMRKLPQGSFVAKVPGKPALVVHAPFVPVPHIFPRQLAALRERLRALPHYHKSQDEAPPELPPRSPSWDSPDDDIEDD